MHFLMLLFSKENYKHFIHYTLSIMLQLYKVNKLSIVKNIFVKQLIRPLNNKHNKQIYILNILDLFFIL